MIKAPPSLTAALARLAELRKLREERDGLARNHTKRDEHEIRTHWLVDRLNTAIFKLAVLAALMAIVMFLTLL